jgi:hypothetical protein
MRTTVTAVALVFIAAFAFGTVYWMVDQGPDLFAVLGLIVLALLAFGIFGALG